jgi:hypothetical protein
MLILKMYAATDMPAQKHLTEKGFMMKLQLKNCPEMNSWAYVLIGIAPLTFRYGNLIRMLGSNTCCPALCQTIL